MAAGRHVVVIDGVGGCQIKTGDGKGRSAVNDCYVGCRCRTAGSPWEERLCSPAVVRDEEGGCECEYGLRSHRIRVRLVVADLLNGLDCTDGESSVVVLTVDGEDVDVLPGDGGDSVGDS
ncbi:hypothetical protein ACLOJK_020661 [Asimina triloba]